MYVNYYPVQYETDYIECAYCTQVFDVEEMVLNLAGDKKVCFKCANEEEFGDDN